MKKILNIIIAIIGVVGLFTACETERDNPVLDSNAIEKPTITSTLPATIVITADNLESEYATVKYTPAIYSTPAPVTNQVQISLSNAFPDDQTTSVGAAASEDNIVITNKVLNSAIVAVGGVTLTQNTAWLRIKSAVSATTGSPELIGLVSYSDAVQVTITPYEPQPAYIYVPGAHQGWDPGTAPALCSLTDNGIYVGYIQFDAADVEFKFTQARGWDVNWGSADGATLVSNGDNIKSPSAGWYKITVDLNALNFTMELFGNLGVVGTINSWAAPDVPMTYNDAKHRFEATITCTGNDEIKFRLNEDWGTNWGGKDGILGGDNIVIAEAGTYLVTVDFLTEEYSITKQ
jgi:hypothetical protein